MQFVNRIPRFLRVLITLVILAILVWKFGTNDYFHPAIGASIIIILILVMLTYRTPRNKLNGTNSSPGVTKNQVIGMSGNDPELLNNIQEQTTCSTPDSKRTKSSDFKKLEPRSRATDVAAKYIAMGKIIDMKNKSDLGLPDARDTQSKDRCSLPIPAADPKIPSSDNVDPNSTEPPIPLIEDKTSLTVEETNRLINAVWCRCENPFCKDTRFLGVHHITNEESGGKNTLDNLIVLCPYCHDLTHKKKIPETKMRDWIQNKEERFKFKIDWPY